MRYIYLYTIISASRPKRALPRAAKYFCFVHKAGINNIQIPAIR